MTPQKISIIIPFLDEAGSLETLYAEVNAALDGLSCDAEIIFVNDGSSDDGPDKVAALAARDSRVSLINLRRNFGKAAALSAGFGAATGEVVLTMDADLQDDPAEIPAFLEAIAKGADVVSGWKHVRNDPIDKTLPSRVFNRLTSWAFGIKLHDINCGFKAYRREAVTDLNLYGELHRFTPAILNGAGYRVAEVKVNHRSRTHGVSKYGASRFLKGLLDLFTVLLMTRYAARPSHFFALAGLPLLLLGMAMVGYLVVLWFLDQGPIGTRPLLQIGILFIVTGVQLLGIGLIAELVLASRISERDKYSVRDVVKGE